jgi:ribonucleoside-diphosphate reductase alpha chain
MFQRYWCEHNPSITVYVKNHEWLEVGAWVYANFDLIGGVSFLPYSDHIYKQAPYQEVSAEEYDKLVSEFPQVDWSLLPEYEKEDGTTASHDLACSAGVCEIVDMVKAA